jgi:2-isopropylmalate synthase
MSEQSVCISYPPFPGHRESVHVHDQYLIGVNILPDRTWSGGKITRAPRWLSTDLRESNQGVMPAGHKLKIVELLSQTGCQEIEVGCPAVSQDHFDFVRRLIDEDRIQPDVQISVLTQARTDLVFRTVASLSGAARAIIHLCNADSPFPGHAFSGGDHETAMCMVAGAVDVMRASGPQTPWSLAFEYSLQICADSGLHAVLEACAELADVWRPSAGRELILNFSASLGCTTPSIFADQVEWLGRHLVSWPHTCLSVHPHNDAGTGVAAAELALLAGAQRVEGCLLGHGKRTQDISLVTLGMNLRGQGVNPQVDLSRLGGSRDVAAPGAAPEGDGAVRSPDDGAIGGADGRTADGVDTGPDGGAGGSPDGGAGGGADAGPDGGAGGGADAGPDGGPGGGADAGPDGGPGGGADAGPDGGAGGGADGGPDDRTDIQVSVADVDRIMRAEHGLDLPAGLRAEFAGIVRAFADASGHAVSADQMRDMFELEYMVREPASALLMRCSARCADLSPADPWFTLFKLRQSIRATEDNAVLIVAGTLAAMGLDVIVLSRYSQLLQGSNLTAVYVHCVAGVQAWGVGIGGDLTAASLKAVLSAVNRAEFKRVAARGWLAQQPQRVALLRVDGDGWRNAPHRVSVPKYVTCGRGVARFWFLLEFSRLVR